MSKPFKPKNGKVPKITEEEYAAYLCALKSSADNESPASMQKGGLAGAGMRSMHENEKK